MNYRKVMVYKDSLLPFSETFILSQVESMVRYRGLYVGIKRITGSGLLEGRDVLVLEEAVTYPRLSSTLFKLVGWTPSRWFDDIEAFAPEIIHAHFGTCGVRALSLRRKLGVPLVTTFHGSDITINKRSAALGHSIYTLRRRRLFQEADLIIAVSGFIRSKLIENGCRRTRSKSITLASIRKSSLLLGALNASRSCSLLDGWSRRKAASTSSEPCPGSRQPYPMRSSCLSATGHYGPS